jgi:hypothetical protein
MTIPTTVILIAAAFLIGHYQVAAGASIERTTLMLAGAGCQRLHEDVEEALRRLAGVRAVDTKSVPGHVLIDVERGRVTAEQLAAEVARLAGSDEFCRASVMESCITAAPMSRHAGLAPDTRGDSR